MGKGGGGGLAKQALEMAKDLKLVIRLAYLSMKLARIVEKNS
jgi:hypothetical protein